MGKLNFSLGDLIESRYRVIEEIGAGGMGQLYRVADTGHKDAELALKMVRLQASEISETDYLEKFQQEFRLLTQLWHPNLIKVHDYGVTEGGNFYYTMAYVEGANLSGAMAGMGLTQLVPTMVQICRALAYLHARGVIHGDLKPANVLLAVPAGDQVRLVDFGVALEMQAQQGDQRFITPYYSAPEVALKRKIDGRADLYSLGTIAYTWLVGEPPNFMLGADRLIAMTLREALSEQRDLPPDMEEVIARLLAENADQRYTNANAVIEALNLATGSAYALETKDTASSYALRARFVGRDSELAQLHGLWQQAIANQGRLVLIGGESGVGKTRLVEELEVQAELGGARVIWGQCLESGGSAYHPWREVLRVLLSYVEGFEGADLERLGPVLAAILPELWHRPYMAGLSPPAELEPAAAQQRLNDAIVQVLQVTSVIRPTLVVVEDVHWADEATLVLIDFLARVLNFNDLMVCVTYRSEEVAGDDFLVQLGGQYVRRVLLQNLIPEHSDELVESMLGIRRLPAVMVAKIQQITAGNTFFVQELIRSLAEEGVVLQRTLDGWRVDEQALAEVGLPESIQQVVWERLEKLSPDTQQVLRWAAIVGPMFWDGAVEEIGQASRARVQAALGDGLDKGLIFERETSAFEGEREFLFAKPAVREVSYESVSPPQRLETHGRVAAWLMARSDDEVGEHLGLIGGHLERSGQTAQAVIYMHRAGEQAAAQFANVEGIAHFTRGVQLLERLPDTPERVQQELALQIGLGILLATAKGYAAPEPRRAYARAWELCQQIGETPELIPMLLRLWSVYLVGAEHQTAFEVAEQILSLAQRLQEPLQIALAHWTQGMSLFCLGELAPALAHLEEVIAFYDPQQHGFLASLLGQDPGITCLSWAAWILWCLGFPDQALKRSQEALSLARELAHPLTLGFALNSAVHFHDYLGKQQAVLELTEALTRHVTDHGLALYQAGADITQGLTLTEVGRVEEGIAQIRQGLAAYWATGSRMDYPNLLMMLATAYGLAEQAEEGLSLLAEALAMVEDTGERFYEAEMHRRKGELLLMQGEAEAEVESCFQHAIALARRQGAKTWELRAALSLSRLWHRQGKPAEARQLLAGIYSWFGEGFDTADLQKAKALLEELSQENRAVQTR